MLALEDKVNIESPYNSGFNMTLESEDKNFDGQSVPDFKVTVEDNDEGVYANESWSYIKLSKLSSFKLMALNTLPRY